MRSIKGVWYTSQRIIIFEIIFKNLSLKISDCTQTLRYPMSESFKRVIVLLCELYLKTESLKEKNNVQHYKYLASTLILIGDAFWNFIFQDFFSKFHIVLGITWESFADLSGNLLWFITGEIWPVLREDDLVQLSWPWCWILALMPWLFPHSLPYARKYIRAPAWLAIFHEVESENTRSLIPKLRNCVSVSSTCWLSKLQGQWRF